MIPQFLGFSRGVMGLTDLNLPAETKDWFIIAHQDQALVKSLPFGDLLGSGKG